MRTNARFLAALGLLASTAFFLKRAAEPRSCRLGSTRLVSRAVRQMDRTDIELTPDILNVLGPAISFYVPTAPTVIGCPTTGFHCLFPTQRTGDTIHSPKNCLPGAGWAPIESSRVPLSLPGKPLSP